MLGVVTHRGLPKSPFPRLSNSPAAKPGFLRSSPPHKHKRETVKTTNRREGRAATVERGLIHSRPPSREMAQTPPRCQA